MTLRHAQRSVACLPLTLHSHAWAPWPRISRLGLLPMGGGGWAQVGLEVLQVGKGLTVQSHGLGKLPDSEVSEP